VPFIRYDLLTDNPGGCRGPAITQESLVRLVIWQMEHEARLVELGEALTRQRDARQPAQPAR
jgi:hypothetical protein